MAILEKKSLGNIQYVLIDDIYPTFSGTIGTVAVTTAGDFFTCESGYTWSTYTTRNIGAEIFAYNHTDTATFLPTLDTWTTFNSVATTTPFSATVISSGLTLLSGSSTPRLTISGDNIGRFLTITSNTYRSSNAQWNQLRSAASRNNVAPNLRFNLGHFGTDAINEATNITTPTIFTGTARNNEFFVPAFYVDSRESATAYLNRNHTKLSVELIEPPVFFNETGKKQNFEQSGWVTVNDTTNIWFMGTGTTFSGGGTSMYISSNGGVTPSYNNAVGQVSHFYKDITFPKNLQSDVLLEFFWKSVGELGQDYGRVYWGTTGNTPVAGVQNPANIQIGRSSYSNVVGGTSAFTYESIVIPRLNAIDQTRRLIFQWRNDTGGIGTNPPFCVDSIRLSFYVDDNWNEIVTGDTETFNFSGFSGNGWTVVNDDTNFWVVGTSEFSGTNDTFAAYITESNVTAYYGNELVGFENRALATYNNGALTDQVSHFYKDFTFTSASTLTFNWKCWGENGTGSAINYDYGAVVLTTTATTPVAGTEVSTAQAPTGGNGRIGATTNLGKFNLAYGGADNNWRTETINLGAYSGQTKRLVFTWVNDTSVGNNPPFVLDNIKITGVGNWARRLNKLN